MKRLSLLGFFLILLCELSFAQKNHFTFFRYDYQSYNIGKLIQELSVIRNNENQENVLFFEGRCYMGEECEELIASKNFLAHTSIFETSVENHILDSIFEVMFEETVRCNRGDVSLWGDNDSQWEISFLIHENTSMLNLAQLIDINELVDRRIKISFFVYDDESNVTKKDYDEILSALTDNIIMLNF